MGKLQSVCEPSLSYLDNVADGIYFLEVFEKFKLLAHINK